MPRPCKICAHGQRKEIEAALARGESRRAIGLKFGFAGNTAIKHRDICVPELFEENRGALRTQAAVDLNAEMARTFERVNKLFDACAAWLADPKDPSKYTLDARAGEIQVIYEETQGERTIRRRALLSELLGRLEEKLGVAIQSSESKAADPRLLLLKAAEQINNQIQTLGKLTGAFQQRHLVQVNQQESGPPDQQPDHLSDPRDIIVIRTRVRQDYRYFTRFNNRVKAETGVAVSEEEILDVVAAGFEESAQSIVIEELRRIR